MEKSNTRLKEDRMKDLLIRTVKTFIEAFLGVLIPEIALLLQGNLPEDWCPVVVPIICAALAAGITAAWNAYLGRKKEGAE